MAKELEIGRSTTNFKMNLTKLLHKFSRLKKSLLQLLYFKDYAKSIKKYVKKSAMIIILNVF